MPSSLLLSVRQHVAAFRVLLVLTLIVGLAYPLTVTAVSQLVTPGRANGSLLTSSGGKAGSSLIGQSFSDANGNALPQWFQPRPSAAGAGYDPTSSGASNLGPENSELLKAVERRRAAAAALDDVRPDLCRPTPSPPRALAWTRTSAPRTPSSRWPGSLGSATWTRQRSVTW